MNKRKNYTSPKISFVPVLVNNILTASIEIEEDSGDNDGEWV